MYDACPMRALACIGRVPLRGNIDAIDSLFRSRNGDGFRHGSAFRKQQLREFFVVERKCQLLDVFKLELQDSASEAWRAAALRLNDKFGDSWRRQSVWLHHGRWDVDDNTIGRRRRRSQHVIVHR